MYSALKGRKDFWEKESAREGRKDRLKLGREGWKEGGDCHPELYLPSLYKKQQLFLTLRGF